jgi:hypothetical protein
MIAFPVRWSIWAFPRMVAATSPEVQISAITRPLAAAARFTAMMSGMGS